MAGHRLTPVFLGLGSNLGDREANLRRALHRLQEGVRGLRCSPIYETEPVGFTAQPPFLNLVCGGETVLSPQALLALAKRTERELGRAPSFPNAPRPIDIDLLLYGDLVLEEPGLVLPHPRMAERAFVLVPLSDLAPDLVHPLLGQPVRDLLRQVGREGVRLWAPPPALPARGSAAGGAGGGWSP